MIKFKSWLEQQVSALEKKGMDDANKAVASNIDNIAGQLNRGNSMKKQAPTLAANLIKTTLTKPSANPLDPKKVAQTSKDVVDGLMSQDESNLPFGTWMARNNKPVMPAKIKPPKDVFTKKDISGTIRNNAK